MDKFVRTPNTIKKYIEESEALFKILPVTISPNDYLSN